jgi:hypothetical protein
METKNFRYHAYRSYALYIHGLLGKFNRKVIPACLVKRIRDMYPSDGGYTGYIHVDPNSGEVVPHDELEQLQIELAGELATLLCGPFDHHAGISIFGDVFYNDMLLKIM